MGDIGIRDILSQKASFDSSAPKEELGHMRNLAQNIILILYCIVEVDHLIPVNAIMAVAMVSMAVAMVTRAMFMKNHTKQSSYIIVKQLIS